MAPKLIHYTLSAAADEDLQDIFDFTAQTFGTDQAAKYLLEIEGLFFQLCALPKLGRPRNEIKKDLRSISYESHIVFYRVMKN